MRALIAAAMLLAALPAAAQSAPPPEALKDLAPTGKLRAAINFGNGVLAKKGRNGEPRGVSAELAAALAKKVGVPLDHVRFEAAGKVFEALAKREVDVSFIAIEPKRAAEVTFAPPYVLIEGTYLVRRIRRSRTSTTSTSRA
ncbi:MAG TPA: transporter substrate-binding domain-containing protein [Xanthobacteraceae bacterium]|nr:transporter substrate-binding domain-containing protein [Xanthobacteraceae bacterium]